MTTRLSFAPGQRMRVAALVLGLLWLILTSLGVFNAPPALAQRLFFSAAEMAIHYIGRTARGESVLWTWPASGLRVSFSGTTALSLRLRAPDFPEASSQGAARMLWYNIDGGAWTAITVPPGGAGDFPLALPADRARHTLAVVKASEGQIYFDGLVLDAGGKLARPNLPTRRIEIVGDSITAGFRVNGEGSYQVAGDHDARSTYGWLLGDALDAEVRLTAVTGYGVVHNFGVGAAESRTLPNSYPFLHRGSTLLNDWSWQPDVIVINLGTNDMAPPAQTPPAVFASAYASFLAMLRLNNPRALIIAMQPFGLENGGVPVYPAEIRAAIQTRLGLGDTHVTYLDTAGWLGRGDFTDGVHPNIRGNRKAADKLIAVLKVLLGS